MYMRSYSVAIVALALSILSTPFLPPSPVGAHEFREHSPGPSPKAVLYLFYFSGSACDSCAALKPLVQTAQSRYRGLVAVEEVNVDLPKNHEFAQAVGLSGIPSMYVVGRHGERFARLEGYGESSEVLADLAMALPRAAANADAACRGEPDQLAPMFLERIQHTQSAQAGSAQAFNLPRGSTLSLGE